MSKYGEDKLLNEGLKVFTTCRVDYQRKALEAMEKGSGGGKRPSETSSHSKDRSSGGDFRPASKAKHP